MSKALIYISSNDVFDSISRQDSIELLEQALFRYNSSMISLETR